MWLWKTKDGDVREFADISGEKRCPICGQYFKKGEKGAVIVPPMEARKQHKKFNQNYMVHLSEWLNFIANCESEEDVIAKFIKHRTPRIASFTDEEVRRMDAFRQACNAYSFFVEYTKPYGVKRQARGSSVAVEYNVFSDKIDISHRGKRGLFDSFYERQICANIFNKMHEILGDGRHDDYSAVKTISGIADEVNKTMKEIGF